MLLGVTPHRAGLFNANTEQITPRGGISCSRAQIRWLLRSETPLKRIYFHIFKGAQGCRKLSLAGADTQRITGLRAAQYNRMEVRALPFRFVLCAYAYESRLLTVSPVPKTITSYSSSMLYHRLSRLALFRPEM